MTTPSFAQHLTSWKQAVSGDKHPPLPIEIVATSVDEFQGWQAQLQSAKIDAGKHGFPCQFNKGGSKSGRMAAWITSGGFTLKIAFTAAKVAKHTNVTETSRNSYRSQDFTTQEHKVAKAIFDHSILGGDITRAEIANWTGIQEGRVSARVFSLLKQYRDGGYTDKSGNYRLVLTAPRLSVFVGASKVPNEAMRFDKCEPSPVGEQTEMRF